MQPDTPLLDEWLFAEMEAGEAEGQLVRAMLDTTRGGCAPTPDLVQTARAKRAKAHSLFDEAMHEMKTLAESLHHRRIETRPGSVSYLRQRGTLEGHEPPPESS
ncbi:hypothetical protein ACPWT1_00465 [Ramlibacter sp. MMS24-I3-19]|uniref:hypothetical protein n=1 Tax=Ramlibacter sp. MMS24-I3-19 TaxID=3416606 RepID=UPI003CFD50B7